MSFLELCKLFYLSINQNLYLDNYYNTLKNNRNAIVYPIYFNKFKVRFVKLFNFIVIVSSFLFVFILWFKEVITILSIWYKTEYKSLSLLKETFKCFLFVNESSVFQTINNNADLFVDFCIISSPKYEMDKNKFTAINVVQFLKLGDIFKIILDSFVLVLMGLVRVDKKGILYLANGLEWLVAEFVFCKLEDKEVVFSNQKDRWVILFDSLKFQKLTKLQHGTNILKGYRNINLSSFYKFVSKHNSYALKSYYMIRNVDRLVCFTDKEKDHVLIGEFENYPSIIEIIGYNFRLKENKSLSVNNNSVLIIANPDIYIENEIEIIECFNKAGFNIFIKNHPLCSDNYYKELLDKCSIVYDTIDCDIVISYYSTLGYEYESVGKKVYYYDDYEDVASMCKRILGNED